MTAPDPSSVLGYGLSATYCTMILPYVDDTGTIVMRAVTTIQPPLGVGTDPRSGAVLPSVVSGRPLLAEAILRRVSTVRGTLPDTAIPTTTASYGIDILDSANADLTEEEAGQLSASVDAQCRQDERIVSSTTAGALVGNVLILPIVLRDGSGPFRLTLGIDVLDANLSILSAPTT